MRLVRCLLIAAALLAMLWLVPSEHALAETRPIPLDLEVMPKVNEDYYTSDTHYEDPSLTVDIQFGRAYDTDYLVARVTIADPTQLRSYISKATMYASRMAKRVNAVIAITGDNYRDNLNYDNRMHVRRQGKEIYVRNWPEDAWHDFLLVDSSGDFHIIRYPTRADVDACLAQYDIVNTFCFGPALWADGERLEAPTGTRATRVGWGNKAQRLCFCQTGPGEYMIVACGGPDNPNCAGLTGAEFMEVIDSEGDPICAYNLNGGNSAWVVFRGEKINLFGRRPSQGLREINDIIYFASAWSDE